MSRKELDEELSRIMKKLREDDTVKQVILFGSLARDKDLHQISDIDLIIVKNTNKKFLDRLDEYYVDASETLDILVYTPEEFDRMKERPFIKRALKEGRILLEA
jgi:predicted nucleotidyltransferase